MTHSMRGSWGTRCHSNSYFSGDMTIVNAWTRGEKVETFTVPAEDLLDLVLDGWVQPRVVSLAEDLNLWQLIRRMSGER